MKPYGIPRLLFLELPDVADIKYFALKSSTGKFPEKCGKYKSYTRNSTERKRIRRYWKRRERAKSKIDIKEY